MTQKYIPTKWIANETIGTANVMNNIEQGIVEVYDEIERIDSQLAHNTVEIERIENEIESEISEVIDKINNLELGGGVSNLATKEDLEKLNEELETHTHEEYVTELELNNKGYLTQHQDLSSYAKKSELHNHNNKSVLDKITNDKFTEWNNKSTFDGNYNSLTNKPSIPTKVSQLTNDSNFLTQHQDISGKADKTELHNHTNKTVLDKITSAKVQSWDNKSTFSGSYNDLTNKPIIPSIEGLATEDFVKNEIAKIDTSIDVVDSVEDMVDTTKQYVHSGTNTWWRYRKVTTPAGGVLPNVDNAINWTSTEVLLNKRINSSYQEVDAPGCALFYFNFSKEKIIQVDFTPKSSTRYIALTIKVSASSITTDDIADYVITLDNDTTNLLDIGEIYLNKRYSHSGGGITDDGEGLFALIVPLVGDGSTPRTLKFKNLKYDIASNNGSTLYMLDSNKANASSVNGNSNFALMTEGVTVVPSEIEEILKTVDPVWVRMKGCSVYNTNGNKTSTKVATWDSSGTTLTNLSPYSQILMYEETENGISGNPYSTATFPYDNNKTTPVTAIKFGYYNKTTGDNSTNGKSSHYDSIVEGKYALSLIVNFASATAITKEDLKDVYITFNEPIVSYEEITVEGWFDTEIEYNPNDDSSVVDLGIKVSELEDRVEELEKRPVGGGNASTTSTLPPYWKNRLDEISPKIDELQDEYGVDAFQFLWCSDIHSVPGSSPNNTTYLGEIGRYVIDKYNIPFFTVSGDIMSQASHSSVEAIWTEYDKLNNMFSPIRNDEFLATKGNHDGAWGSPVDGVYYLKNVGTKKLFNTIYRRQTLDRNRVFGKNGTYFYVDCHNVRFYVLNAHTDGDGSENENGYANYNPMKHFVFGNEQLNWIADTLLTVQEGQKVIFMAHPPTKYCLDGSVFEGMVASYKNRTNYVGTKNITGTYWGTDEKYSKVSVNKDFANAKGDLVGYFHGHIHKDTITVDGEYPIISITTAGGDLRDDYLTNGTLTRVKGTPTETAIDLVTVTSDYIYFTRIGSGYDRKYNRVTKEVTVDYDSAYIPPEKDPLVKPQGSELYLNQQYSQSNGGFVDKNGYYSIIMPIKANTKYMLSLSNIANLDTGNTTLYTLDADKSNATTINGSKYIHTMSGVTFTNAEKTSATVEFTSDFKSSYAVFVTTLGGSTPISEDNLKGVTVALEERGKAEVSESKEITSEVIWQENTRYSGSDGKPREFADTVASNDIPVKPGDVIRIYGFAKITENYSYSLGYTDDTYVKYHNLYEKNPYDDVDMNTVYDVENNVMTIYVKPGSSINRIRICNYCTDSSILRVFRNMELDEAEITSEVTWIADKRLSSSNGGYSDLTGCYASSDIPCKKGDVIRIYGASAWKYYAYVAGYKSDNTFTGVITVETSSTGANNYIEVIKSTDNTLTITVIHDSVSYIRVCNHGGLVPSNIRISRNIELNSTPTELI